MEGPLTLSDQELNYYHDLFKGCDVDGSGKISDLKALELFKAAGLKTDILSQIVELCGAKRLGHYGRSQFFVALKLIVAAQKGLPVKVDNYSMAKQMNLPTFTSLSETDVEKPDELSSTGDGVKNVPAGQLPPPPAKKHGRSSSGQWRGAITQHSEPTFSTQGLNHMNDVHEPRSPPFSPKQSPPSTPSTKGIIKQQSSPGTLASPAVKQPTASSFVYATNVTGSDDHGGWANFDDDDGRGLLGTGHKKLTDHLDPHTLDSSSMSSETDSMDDVWTINDEQRDYYVQQFKVMQPDLYGVITGNVAKEFFEKSKLPVQELSKIWQLSDVNKDGALSLEEFCTAMHLVVLRRNEIDLPDDLPVTLMPYSALIEDEPFAANLPKGATIKRASPHSPVDKQWVAQSVSAESPLASDVSSPGIKPINFEVKPPDPGILHPVAMRMSPNGHLTDDRSRAMSDPASYDSPDLETEGAVSPSKPRAFTFCDSNMAAEPLHSRPRPVPKKSAPDRGTAGGPGQGLDASLPPPPQLPPRPSQHNRSISVDLKLRAEHNLNAPPAVPPRASPKDPHYPKRAIPGSGGPGGSSAPGGDQLQFAAVDSDRFIKPNATNLKRFEPIPSQEVLTLTSPSDDAGRDPAQGLAKDLLERHRRAISLDYRQMGLMGGGTQATATMAAPSHDVTDSTPGSTDLYLTTDKTGDEPALPVVDESPMAESAAKKKPPARQGSRDRRDYQLAIRTHRECNKMLIQVSSELNQELQEVMEQRIALEIQLEHLRPFRS